MARQILHRTARALFAVLVATTASVALASPAQAEDGYQYWHYVHLQDGAWAMAETGPADHVAEDGDVEGFRFGTSTMSQPIQPRTDDEVTFEAVCEGTEAAEGEKRVAVVLDFGTDEDAGTPPENRAECAVGEESASTQDLLQTVADVRLEGGLACAIDGHPETGCGVPVTDVQVPAEEEPVSFALPASAESAEESAEATGDETGDAAGDDPAAVEEQSSGDDGTLWTLVGVALLVVLIGAVALAMSRRNKTAG